MTTDDENLFDVIIVGTGLVESILAAALSKAKYKVAHIDSNPYYGGDEASLSQDEFVKWGERVSEGRHSSFSSYSGGTQVLPHSRQYSICLKPAVIPSVGPFITSLVASGVAKYSGFKLLDFISIYSADGTVKSVPGSKEAVFNSKEISLIEKRRLMRFLAFAGGEFEDKTEVQGKQDQAFHQFLKSAFQLSDDTVAVILYSLAHCVTAKDRTLPSLLRLRGYLRSIGRYGSSPFLLGHYGGIGEVSQGFCRAAAVNGGVYILGRQILSTQYHPESLAEGLTQESYIEMKLDDFPEVLRSSLLISPNRDAVAVANLPPHLIDIPPSISQFISIFKVARCVAILDRAPSFRLEKASRSEEVSVTSSDFDNGVVIFPPGSLPAGSETSAATVFVNGEGSLSAPKGRWILYIVLPLTSSALKETPEKLLRPYLDAVVQSTNPDDTPTEPLFTSFFFEEKPLEGGTNTLNRDPHRHIITPSLAYSTFPDLPDDATRSAEAVFRQALRSLHEIKGGSFSVDEEIELWPPFEVEEESDDES